MILVDEPISNLNRENLAIVLAAVDAGSAVILVTHDEEADLRSDCVLHMRDGAMNDTRKVIAV